jgi:hypothetical protein
MRDIQVSRPVLIALVGAILVGGFLYFKSSSSSDVAPAAPANTTAGATGGTGASGTVSKTKVRKTKGGTIVVAKGSTSATGATGSTAEATKVVKQTRTQLADARKRRAYRRLVQAAAAAGMPTPVYKALHENKVVLIYFWDPKASDDERTDDSVSFVQSERGSKLYVRREQISNKSKYDGIANVAEITQTPGIVLLYKSSGSTWQGYIDGTALNGQITHLINKAN